MTREENILKERFGKENPFKVPDGYFDHLTERIMDNLPDQARSGLGSMKATARWWLM